MKTVEEASSDARAATASASRRRAAAATLTMMLMTLASSAPPAAAALAADEPSSSSSSLLRGSSPVDASEAAEAAIQSGGSGAGRVESVSILDPDLAPRLVPRLLTPSQRSAFFDRPDSPVKAALEELERRERDRALRERDAIWRERHREEVEGLDVVMEEFLEGMRKERDGEGEGHESRRRMMMESLNRADEERRARRLKQEERQRTERPEREKQELQQGRGQGQGQEGQQRNLQQGPLKGFDLQWFFVSAAASPFWIDRNFHQADLYVVSALPSYVSYPVTAALVPLPNNETYVEVQRRYDNGDPIVLTNFWDGDGGWTEGESSRMWWTYHTDITDTGGLALDGPSFFDPFNDWCFDVDRIRKGREPMLGRCDPYRVEQVWEIHSVRTNPNAGSSFQDVNRRDFTVRPGGVPLEGRDLCLTNRITDMEENGRLKNGGEKLRLKYCGEGGQLRRQQTYITCGVNNRNSARPNCRTNQFVTPPLHIIETTYTANVAEPDGTPLFSPIDDFALPTDALPTDACGFVGIDRDSKAPLHFAMEWTGETTASSTSWDEVYTNSTCDDEDLQIRFYSRTRTGPSTGQYVCEMPAGKASRVVQCEDADVNFNQTRDDLGETAADYSSSETYLSILTVDPGEGRVEVDADTKLRLGLRRTNRVSSSGTLGGDGTPANALNGTCIDPRHINAGYSYLEPHPGGNARYMRHERFRLPGTASLVPAVEYRHIEGFLLPPPDNEFYVRVQCLGRDDTTTANKRDRQEPHRTLFRLYDNTNSSRPVCLDSVLIDCGVGTSDEDWEHTFVNDYPGVEEFEMVVTGEVRKDKCQKLINDSNFYCLDVDDPR